MPRSRGCSATSSGTACTCSSGTAWHWVRCCSSRWGLDGSRRPEPSLHVGSVIVTTLILLRHGRSAANAAGVLAGRSPGVELDDAGLAQAQKVVERLAGVPIAEIVCSPMGGGGE